MGVCRIISKWPRCKSLVKLVSEAHGREIVGTRRMSSRCRQRFFSTDVETGNKRRRSRLSELASQPSLRDLLAFSCRVPNAEALGYSRLSLRDRGRFDATKLAIYRRVVDIARAHVGWDSSRDRNSTLKGFELRVINRPLRIGSHPTGQRRAFCRDHFGHRVLQRSESALRKHTKARARPRKCCPAAAFPDRTPAVRSAQPKTFGCDLTLAGGIHSSDKSTG